MAKRPPTATADLLYQVGRTLYPSHYEWLAPFAHELDVQPRALQAWLSGKMQLAPDHDVMRRAGTLLRARRKAIDAVIKRLAAG